ncbi:MAG: hypothetical protein IJY28_06410 [Clostridia bacterium]|nr:hypothetical protein [Clostridia bacterium]
MSREETIQLLNTCADQLYRRMDTMEEVAIEVRDPLLTQKIRYGMDAHRPLQSEAARLLQEYGVTAETHPVVLLPGRLNARLRMALQPSGAAAAAVLTDGCCKTMRLLHRAKNQCPAADASVRQLADAILHTEERISEQLKSHL